MQVLKLQRDAVVARVEATEAIAQGTLRYPEEVRAVGVGDVVDGCKLPTPADGSFVGGLVGRTTNTFPFLPLSTPPTNKQNKPKQNKQVKAEDEAGVLGCLGAQLAYYGAVIGYYWHTAALSLCVLRLLACVCWFLSICFLWSEVVLGSPLALSPYGALQQAFGTNSPLAIQLSVAIPLAYVSCCAYRSLFKFKLFSEVSLQGPHQSLARPLLVNATYLIRLQFPLAYNFLLLLRSPSSKETAFRHLMSNMAVVPVLGRGFTIYAPLVVVVLAVFTFTRGYARLLRLVGAYHEDLISGEEQEGARSSELGCLSV